MVQDFLVALRFLTVIPFSKTTSTKPEALARSMIFFPPIGFLIGGVSLGLFVLSKSIFPERFAVLILLVAPFLLSGGLHMDGFADFCDGFFGEKEKSEVLRIMKDSRIGAWGAVGVVFLIIAKFELLQVLPHQAIFFLMAVTCSRWAQVALSFYLPYAGIEKGLGEAVARQVRFREFFGATLFLLPLIYLILIPGIFVFGGLVIFLVLLGLFFHRKIGGLTGDLLGAANELTELCVYILATAMEKYV